MLERGFQDRLPSPSHLAMLVWKIKIKSYVDCVYQHCKGKGASRVGGVSTTSVNEVCSIKRYHLTLSRHNTFVRETCDIVTYFCFIIFLELF